MSQLRRVFSGLAQACTKQTMVPTPPETSIRLLMVLTRSSGVPMVEAAPSPPAVFSTASSGEVNGCRPGRCSVPTLYSLCQRISPAPASRCACSRVSAMCQLNKTRQSDRLTVVPCFLAVALRHRIDAQRMRVGGQCTRSGTEDGAATGHVVELHHALGDVEGVVVGQRLHAGAELDAFGALAGRGQKHFRRRDGFPARGVMLAAPELVVTERVELLDQIEVAAELQHRMLADRMMRGEEGSEFQARHEFSLRTALLLLY